MAVNLPYSEVWILPLVCIVSHPLFLLSSTTGISEADSSNELTVSYTRYSLLLSTILVPKHPCWTSSGVVCWIGTLLPSDDVLLRPPYLIQACAHIRLEQSGEGGSISFSLLPYRRCHISGKGSNASTLQITHLCCVKASGAGQRARAALALPALSQTERIAAGSSIVMQKGAGEDCDLTYVFWAWVWECMSTFTAC